MIDTIRFKGMQTRYNFTADYSRFIGYRRKDGTEKVVEVCVEKNEHYQVFLNPNEGTVTVQCNPHKSIFGINAFNYEKNPVLLKQFVRLVASYFFDNGDCWVSRIDIGGVTTYEDIDKAKSVIERFRGTRVPGGSIKKYRHQNYPSSVFYWSRHWSIKIYNKGVEIGYKEEDEIKKRSPNGFDLLKTVRYEKTYRFRELERVGSLPYQKINPDHKKYTDMPVKPNWGIYIDDLQMDLILFDFEEIFKKWDFAASDSVEAGSLKGLNALLHVVDKKGALSEAESMGYISRSSLQRYRAAKKKNPEFVPFVDFQENLDTISLRNKRKAFTFGLSSFYNADIG